MKEIKIACFFDVGKILGKRVSSNAKAVSVIDILRLRSESDVDARKKELEIKERQMALEERKLVLQEKQFEIERLERENVLNNLRTIAEN